MNEPADPTVALDFYDAEALWEAWAPGGDEDILARAAFERSLRHALGLDDEGLYFRPGGWVVNLPATAARIACVSAALALSFHLAGLEDLDTEIAVAAASFVASMDVRPVRVGRQERRLATFGADRFGLAERQHEGTPEDDGGQQQCCPAQVAATHLGRSCTD